MSFSAKHFLHGSKQDVAYVYKLALVHSRSAYRPAAQVDWGS